MAINFSIRNKTIYSYFVSTFEWVGKHTRFEFGLVGGAINMVALYSRRGKIEVTLI